MQDPRCNGYNQCQYDGAAWTSASRARYYDITVYYDITTIRRGSSFTVTTSYCIGISMYVLLRWYMMYNVELDPIKFNTYG